MKEVTIRKKIEIKNYLLAILRSNTIMLRFLVTHIFILSMTLPVFGQSDLDQAINQLASHSEFKDLFSNDSQESHPVNHSIIRTSAFSNQQQSDVFVTMKIKSSLWDHINNILMGTAQASSFEDQNSQYACYPVTEPSVSVSQGQLDQLYQMASSKIGLGPVNLSEAKEAYSIIKTGNISALAYPLTSKAGTMVFGKMVSGCMLQPGCLILQNLAMSTVNDNLAIQFDDEAVRNQLNAEKTDVLVQELRNQKGSVIFVNPNGDACKPIEQSGVKKKDHSYGLKLLKYFVSFIIGPSAQARVTKGYRNMGCLDSQGRLDHECRCQKTGNCFDIRPDEYYRLDLPIQVRKSIDYIMTTANKLQSGLIQPEDVDLDKIKRHKEFLKKAIPHLVDHSNKKRMKQGLKPIDIDTSDEAVQRYFFNHIAKAIPKTVVKNFQANANNLSQFPQRPNSFDSFLTNIKKTTQGDISHLNFVSEDNKESMIHLSQNQIDQLKYNRDLSAIMSDNLDFSSASIHNANSMSLFDIISSRYLKVFFSVP